MRLFLALELPREARAELERAEVRLRRSCTGWRWVTPENVHLTLRFLGEVRSEEDREHRSAFREAVRSFAPVRFRLGSAGVFPGRSRPSVLWIGVHEEPPGALSSLASAIEAAARALGFPPEERPFHPHLTLARAQRSLRAIPPAEEAVQSGCVVECSEVVLFLSELSPVGAHYRRLEGFPLAGAARGSR